MESTLDSSSSPDSPDLGLVKHVILIGERTDGTPVLTIIESNGKSPINISVEPESGEAVQPAQTTFPTQKALLSFLADLFRNKSYDLTSKGPGEEPKTKFRKVYKPGEAE